MGVANEPRWWMPWRRASRQTFSAGFLLNDQVAPVLRVDGDDGYLSGRPGWRGAILNATSSAVAARRSTVLILAEGGPLQIRWLLPSVGVTMLMQSCGAARTLIANDTDVTPLISRSGDPKGSSVFTGVGTLASGGGWSGKCVVGDLDAAALTAGMSVTVVGGVSEWRESFHLDLNRGECCVLTGTADNTGINVKAEVWEFIDWIGS